MQGGTHEEMPHPAVLVMNGAARLLAKAGVSFGVVKVETSEAKELELIEGKAQFPRDIRPPDREGVVMWSNEGHGIVVK